ncbi:hypothetical protein DFP78_103242 [Photobacterium lutimaris]|nr:hypothetical protein DFP78_103242 [Photobacterium lutimaris]
MDESDARRLRTLEEENAKLKKLLAESMLEVEALKVALNQKYRPLKASGYICLEMDFSGNVDLASIDRYCPVPRKLPPPPTTMVVDALG